MGAGCATRGPAGPFVVQRERARTHFGGPHATRRLQPALAFEPFELLDRRLFAGREPERVVGLRPGGLASLLGLAVSPRLKLVRDLLDLACDLAKFERIVGLYGLRTQEPCPTRGQAAPSTVMRSAGRFAV